MNRPNAASINSMSANRLRGAVVVSVAAAGLLLAACGSSGGGGGSATATTVSPLVTAGKDIAQTNCLGCHTLTTRSKTGPGWLHLAGSQVQLDDGTTVTADDNYLIKAIQDPDAQIVNGFQKGLMSSAVPPGSLTANETRALVAYIDSLH